MRKKQLVIKSRQGFTKVYLNGKWIHDIKELNVRFDFSEGCVEYWQYKRDHKGRLVVEDGRFRTDYHFSRLYKRR